MIEQLERGNFSYNVWFAISVRHHIIHIQKSIWLTCHS